MAFLAAASVFVAGLVWGARLLVRPGPFDEASAALLLVSIVITSSVACVGLVMARGRWARRVSLGLLAGELALALVMDLDGWGVTALAASALGLVLVAGPWLDRFLRQLPPAEPLPVPALTLAIGLLVVPGALGLSAPSGVGPVHWAAGLGALVVAWAFARALPAGLWLARIVIPLLVVAAGFSTPLPGALVVAAMAAALAVMAWTPSAARSVSPLIPRVRGVGVPPELVPPEMLARAGYDERGRPAPPRQ